MTSFLCYRNYVPCKYEHLCEHRDCENYVKRKYETFIHMKSSALVDKYVPSESGMVIIIEGVEQWVNKIGSRYPCGPCPGESEYMLCSCGYIFTLAEAVLCADFGKPSCDIDDCDIGQYCGCTVCPNCKRNIHCGGCI